MFLSLENSIKLPPKKMIWEENFNWVTSSHLGWPMAQVTLALMIMNRRNHQKMISFFRSNLWMSKLGGIIVNFKLDNKSFYKTMTPPPLSLSSYVS
jgi:hypothetical protein